jgi:type II secretory pathway component PulC
MMKDGWGLVAAFLIGSFLFFFLVYKYYNRRLEKSPSIESIEKVPRDSLGNPVNKNRPSGLIPPAGEEKSSLEIAPVRAISREDGAPLVTPDSFGNESLTENLTEDLREEPPAEVFFGCLKLVGTIISEYNPLKNKAVIENLLTSRQRTYTQGSVIPYGAKIIEIDKKGITLEKEGVQKSLLVSEKLGDPADIADLKSKGYKKIAEKEWLITPNNLIKDTDHIFELLSEASIRPRFDAWGINGFQVNDVKPGGLIKELGLEGGDTISTVNGETIDSIAKAYKIYQQVRYAPVINIGLKRQQREINLAYHIISDGPPKYDIKSALGSSTIAKLFVGE